MQLVSPSDVRNSLEMLSQPLSMYRLRNNFYKFLHLSFYPVAVLCNIRWSDKVKQMLPPHIHL